MFIYVVHSFVLIVGGSNRMHQQENYQDFLKRGGGCF